MLGRNSVLRGRWGSGTAAQSCGCPSWAGGARGHGWGPVQPDLVLGSPAHGKGAGNGWSLRSLRYKTLCKSTKSSQDNVSLLVNADSRQNHGMEVMAGDCSTTSPVSSHTQAGLSPSPFQINRRHHCTISWLWKLFVVTAFDFPALQLSLEDVIC